MKKKKKGILSKITRIRVKKLEKKPGFKDSSNIKVKSNDFSNISFDVKRSSQDFIDNPKSSSKNIIIDEKDETKEKIKEKKENVNIDIEENSNLIVFDHELTKFEYKLKYLNLRDLDGSEYGRYFPPIRNKIIIIDEEDRNYTVIRAGNNQLTGDLLTFFKKNDIKPGDIFKFEYDPDERNDDGLHLLRLKKKE